MTSIYCRWPERQLLLNDKEQLTLTDLNECRRVSLVLSRVPPRGQNLQQPLLNSLHKKHHHNIFYLYFFFTGCYSMFILPYGVLAPATESCTAQDASVLNNIDKKNVQTQHPKDGYGRKNRFLELRGNQV
jgi:hypothetical protein